MDNSPIHRKNVIRELVEAGGHQLIFLPKYSPDFNDIEHDFSLLKRAVFTYQYISIWKLFVIIVQNNVSLLFEITIDSYIAILFYLLPKSYCFLGWGVRGQIVNGQECRG